MKKVLIAFCIVVLACAFRNFGGGSSSSVRVRRIIPFGSLPSDDYSVARYYMASTNNPLLDSADNGVSYPMTNQAGGAMATWIGDLGQTATNDLGGLTNGISGYYSFDGGDYMKGGATPPINKQPFTVSMWLDIPDIIGNHWIYGHGDFDVRPNYSGYTVTNRIRWLIRDAGSEDLGINVFDYSVNKWQKHDFVFDGTNIIHAYIDGELRGSATNSSLGSAWTNNNVLTLGTHTFSGTPFDFYIGPMDSPTIYTQALSQATIQSNFLATATTHGYTSWDVDNWGTALYSNLAVNLNFNMSTPADYSLNSYGITNSSTTFTGTTSNGYRVFNGSTAYMQLGDFAPRTLTPFSVATWVKTTAATGTSTRIASKMNSQTANKSRWQFNRLAGGNIGFEMKDDAETQIFAPGSGVMPTNDTWHFCVATFNGSDTVNVYTNAVIDASATNTLASFTNDDALYLGVYIDGAGAKAGHFNGDIDDFKIFTTELTGAQITNLYNKGLETHP